MKEMSVVPARSMATSATGARTLKMMSAFAHSARPGVHDLRARGAIGVVAAVGRSARAALHRHCEAELGQLSDHPGTVATRFHRRPLPPESDHHCHAGLP
jgi:hypothetical protein